MARCFGIGVAGHDAAGLRALLANDPGQLARVDVGDGDRVALLSGSPRRSRSERQLDDHRAVADDQARGQTFVDSMSSLLVPVLPMCG